LGRVNAVSQALTTAELEKGSGRYAQFIFGVATYSAELVIRQYLLIRVAGLNLTRALLHAKGKPGSSVVYYLPPSWRKIIRKQGFKVASLRTALLWNTFVGMMLAYGVLRIGKIVLSSIKAAFNQSGQQLGRYVYFEGLAPGNLPQPCRDGRSHDIITWYMQWRGRVVNIDTLCHGVIGSEQRAVNGTPVVSVPAPLLPLARFGTLLRFMVWAIGATLIATWDFLRGRWWHALLLNQAALAAQVRIQNPERLAKDYLFHNSGWIYRPLWTYEAEKRGSRITFYFYSTNCEGFKRTEATPPLYYGYNAMNWSHYLVWDEYQADFVRRAVGETANISVVGPIWFHTSAQKMPALPRKAVAVFDVQPMREAFYKTLAIDFDYYTPKTTIQFLLDIYVVLEGFGAVMCLKKKREIGRLVHPRYRHFVQKLDDLANIISIDPNVSAVRLIEGCMAVISMPFTSTAILGKQLGKPSVYYDPLGMIRKDDRAAHGIEIINGPEELKRWLKNIPVESHMTEAAELGQDGEPPFFAH
jgi:polysaccharide biosynthesis PFTS motif protein